MSELTVLFPSAKAQNELEHRVSALLMEALKPGALESASPTIDLKAFRETLGAKTFQAPEDLDDLLHWTIDSLKHGLVHMTHPRYFGLFNPAPASPAKCADQIVAAFNPQICAWSHAPVAVEIENHVIKQLNERVGFSQKAGGHFTSGGSEANNTAAICALTAIDTQFADHGARAFCGQPRLYVSAESHLAWLKIAHQSGIGRHAVRLVSTDGQGCMDVAALETAIKDDLAQGDVPVMIAATAGTTNAGMVDPLHQCADLAVRFGLWYHIDAAWGGALIASDRFSSVLDGLARADSVTIDAHKWFAATMGAGIFLCRDRTILNKAFRVTASYMPSNNIEVDFYVNSMQWSRRFIGLRLFLSLATAGWQGYAKHVEHSIDLIDHLTRIMTKKGWAVANQSRMAVACLIPPDGGESIEQCISRVVSDGNAWVSHAQFERQSVIRVCVTNGTTTLDDVDQLATALG